MNTQLLRYNVLYERSTLPHISRFISVSGERAAPSGCS